MDQLKYNSMAFVPEELEKGMPQKLIQTLFELNQMSEYHFNEIHITTDTYCTIVEWTQRPIDGSYGGKFEFVDEDEYVEKIEEENEEFVDEDEDEDEYVEEIEEENEEDE